MFFYLCFLQVAALVQQVTSEGRPALVLGDFNTLSRWDSPQHVANGLLAWIANGTAAHKPGSANDQHFSRLARKYTTQASAAALGGEKAELAYGPIDALLNATGGRLTDLCALQCRRRESADDAARDPGVQACLRSRCPATEPTLLLPDRAELPPGVAAPPIRVDFLLANEPFLDAVAGPAPPLAEVLVDDRTSTMSDHYPIRVQWTPKHYDLG